MYFYEKEANKLNFANKVLNLQLAGVNKEIDELAEMINEAEEN